MSTNKPVSKIMAWILACVMILTMTPITAGAEGGVPLGASGEIIAFAALPGEIASQTVPIGTSMAALPLPGTLTATVRPFDTATPAGTEEPEETIVSVPVTWESDPDYDGDIEGTYIFTAVVEDYAVRAALPVITVTVDALQNTPDGTAAITFDIPLNESGETAFYLPENKPITEADLLAGVTATDENGGSVPVVVKDADELDMDNPQMRGIYPNPPYVVTYAAAHPVTDEVFTETRDLYITAGDGSITPTANGTVTIGQVSTTDTVALIQSAIQTALDAAASGETVTVDGTFTAATSTLTLTIPSDKKVIWKAVYSGSATNELIKLFGSGEFEVQSGKIEQTGIGVAIYAASSAITVSGGTVSTTTGGYSAIQSGGDVTVSGGKVSTTAANYRAIQTTGNVTVEGGTVEATNGSAIDVSGPNSIVMVSDGTVKATAAVGYAIYADGPNSIVIVSGTANISAAGVGYAIYASSTNSGGSIVILGGTITSGATPSAAGSIRKYNSGAIGYYLGSNSGLFDSSFTAGQDVFQLDAAPALTKDTASGGAYTYTAGAPNAYVGSVVASLPPGFTPTSVTVNGITSGYVVNADKTVTFSGIYDTTATGLTLTAAGTLAGGSITVQSFNTAAFGVNVTKPAATVTATAPANITYGQTLGNPSATASAGGTTFTYSYTGTLLDSTNTAYGPTTTKPSEPGIYTVTAALDSATHAGSGSAMFTISEKDLSWVAGTVSTKTYNGSDSATVNTAPTLDGVINSDTVSVTTGTAKFSDANAGTNKTVSGSNWGVSGAHAWKYNTPSGQPGFANATIDQAPLTVSASDITYTGKTYDGTTAATGFPASLTLSSNSGVIGSDAVTASYTSAVFNSANVNTATTVTVSGLSLGGAQAGNYSLSGTTVTKAATITAKPLTLQADDKTILVNDPEPTYTYTVTGLVGGDTAAAVITTQPNMSVAVFDSSAPTSFTITIAGGATTNTNYSIVTRTNGTLTVTTKTPVTISGLTAANGAYNGQGHRGVSGTASSGAYNGTLEYFYVSVPAGTYSSATQPIDAGDYTLTVSVPAADQTYAGSNTYNFTIQKRDLTVRPKSESMTVGGTLPTFVLEYSGIVGSESIAPSAQPTFSCTGDGSATGSFPITWTNEATTTFTDGTGKVANYNVTKQATGTLTVSAAHTHSYGSAWQSDATNHWHECSCGDKTAIATHTENSGVVTVQPTSTTTGTRTYSCTVCGRTLRTEIIPATGSGSGGGGGGGGGSSDSSTPSTNWTVSVGKQPDMPTTATITINGTVDANGNLSFTVTDAMMKDAIEKAQAEAKRLGKEADGIIIEINVTTTNGVKTMTTKLDQAALGRLNTAGAGMSVNSSIFLFTLDAAAVKELNTQTKNGITFTATPIAKLSYAAAAAIGNRPVFDFTVKDGSGKTITSYGKGTITRGIKYTAASGEKTGSLIIVKIVDGKVQWIDKSSYDNGWVIWIGDSNSVYGVGYKTPAPKFTDTTSHWAKNDIDFVASRGLISGATATTFAPNTAITRADFLMALGKLSGADVSGYKTSSFTDVPSTNPAMPYIEWAVKNKIVAGIGNNKFAPDSVITREQMAVMMVNYAKATSYTLPVSRQAVTFADDAKISAYAKDAVKAIQQTGVISGKPNNLFDPQGNATRGEASAILRRFVELVIDEGTARGWVQNDAGQWQYINTNGKAATGWLTAGENKYYFDDKGVMVYGKWLQIGGKWYYFYADGKLAINTTIDGYTIGSDGARK